MATNFLWGAIPATVDFGMGSALNGLISGSGTAYSAEQGGANSPQIGDLWLHLDTNSNAFGTNSYVSVYLVPSTTPATASGVYPTYTSGSSFKLAGSNYLAGQIFINPTTQSSNVVDEVLQNVVIPAGFYKVILVNNTGTTFPATNNNTLKLIPTPSQY